jgi:sodium/hydrogen exchanger 8
MAGFTLKKREFFRHVGTITLFAVLGTLISTIAFGLLTYLLVVLHIVKRSHLGTAPLIECFLYGMFVHTLFNALFI